jgi:hypothetical protein
MPTTGLPPIHARSSSMQSTWQAAPANTRNRSASSDSPLNPIEPDDVAVTAVAAPLLKQEELSQLDACLHEWTIYNGRPVISREADSMEFLRSIINGDAHAEDGQIFMVISANEDWPVLPASLAERTEGGILQKAKIKFVDPEPPFGYEQSRHSMQYDQIETRRKSEIPEQKFPMADDAAVAQTLSNIANTEPQTRELSVSERLSSFGRSLFRSSGDFSPEDKQAFAALKSTPQLSQNIPGEALETTLKLKLKGVARDIEDLSRPQMPRHEMATASLQILTRVSRLRSTPHQLDCMNDLTKHVLAASRSSTSPLPGEADFFSAMGRHLEALTPQNLAEADLRVTLMKLSRARGQAVNE